MNDILKLSLTELKERLDGGTLSATAATEACLNRLEETRELNAVITVTAERALARAAAFDRGELRGPLAGVPVIVKDNISTAGVATTCASKMLEKYVPPYDATVVRKLEEAGAILIAKANMDEFAMGSATQNSYFGGAKNAVDPTRVPGGSSGGSAAAVAAFSAYAALGSDTGGSIRQPAAFNGVVGFKPTYSVVSRYGLIAFASSLDQIGPITRTVRDAAAVMNVIAGHDPLDSTSADIAYPDYTALDAALAGKKIGVAKEFFGEGLSPDIKAAIDKKLAAAESAGARVVEVSIKSFKASLAAYYVLSSAEAATNLARYDGVKYGFRTQQPVTDYIDLYDKTRSEGFGAEVKRRIMIGNYVLSSGYYDAYYLKALKVRTLVKQDFDRAFEKVDILVTPTAPTAAYKIGEMISDPMKMYLQDVCTIPANLAGLPAISLPCGFNRDGLPIGLQMIGKPLDEASLIRAAYTFEQANEYHKRVAPLGEAKA